MSDIQIGDRVRITDTDYDIDEDPNLANGQLATVTQIIAGEAILVRTDEGPRHVTKDGDGWCFFEEQLQVLAETPE